MINFFLKDFVSAMTLLRQMHTIAAKEVAKDSSLRISDFHKSTFALMLEEWILPVLNALGVNEAKLIRLQALAGAGIYANLEREVSALDDHIRDEVSHDFFTITRPNARAYVSLR